MGYFIRLYVVLAVSTNESKKSKKYKKKLEIGRL